MRSVRLFPVVCGVALGLQTVFGTGAAFAKTAENSLAGDRAALQRAGVRINQETGVPLTNDFALGPGRTVLELAPGEERTVEMQVTSRTSGMHDYTFETEDFAADPTGGSATTLFGPQQGPFPASTWIHPAVPSLRLTHGEQAFVPVTVSVPKTAEPGDHYAALLLKRGLNPNEETSKGFSIVSRVGVLFLITVKGPVVQDAKLVSFASRAPLYWFYPAYLDLTAKNDGTVYAVPTGVIQIRNILGFEVDQIPVKDWFVLRGSSRTLSFDWRPRFALGYYTAAAKLTVFGKDAQMLQTSFWVIPALPVLIVLFAIFLVSFFVQFFFSRFEITRRGK